MATKKSASQKRSENWEVILEEWFLKLPPLSKNAKEIIVNITPWIALIFGILGILVTFSGIGLLTAFSPFIVFGSGFGRATESIVVVLLGLISSILLLTAFPGTKKRKYQGWKMLFWSEVVSSLSSLISFIFSFSLGGIVISLIAFYLIFQIKSYYK